MLFVGVRRPLEIIMERRAASAADKRYVAGSSDDPVPLPVRLWQEEVHRPGVYDLEVDTSLLSPKQCADTIAEQLRQAPYPTTFQKLSNPSSVALEPF